MKLPELLRASDREERYVILGGALLLTLYLCYGSQEFAANRVFGAPAMGTFIWQFCAAFLLLGVLPVCLWKFGLRRPLRDMGIAIGDARFGLRVSLPTILLIVLPLAFLGSRDPTIRAEYPLCGDFSGIDGRFLAYEAAYLLYYVGYETFFRGFLLQPLARRYGAFSAVTLTTLITVAFHMGKPIGEIWGAFGIGILFGWFALRTRSVLWVLLIHAAVGVLTDLFVVIGPGRLR